jgi:hypothetical protein
VAKQKLKRRLPANWRDRIEIVVADDSEENHGEGTTEFILRFKKGRTPKGFRSKIGYLICTENDNGNCYIEDVDVEENFQNRKLGLMLYKHAISEFGNLNTFYHNASNQAKRVWQSLCNTHHYEADFFSGRLTVHDWEHNGKATRHRA